MADALWLDAALAEAQSEVFGFDRADAAHLTRALLSGSLPAVRWLMRLFAELEPAHARLAARRAQLEADLERLKQARPEATLAQTQLAKQLTALDKEQRQWAEDTAKTVLGYLKVVPGLLTTLMDIADRLDLLRAMQDAGPARAPAVTLAELADLLTPAQLQQLQAWITAASRPEGGAA